VGGFLIAVITVCLLAQRRYPRKFGLFAGCLLAAAVAANATIIFNHPLLIELLDFEYEQRRQIAAVIGKSPEKKAMASPHNGRIGVAGAPFQDEQRADSIRGTVYLLYGQWLVGWAIVGILAGSAAPLGRRFVQIGGWSLAGAALACLLCAPRLAAEYHWLQAKSCEAEGDADAARDELEKAVAAYPDFARLERTWLLRGKVDHGLNQPSPQAQFFQAYQMARDKSLPRAVTYREDLPWLIAKTVDYRTGLTSLPAGLYLAEKPDAAETNAPFARERPSSLRGELVTIYRHVLGKEPRRAIALMDDLLTATNRQPAVRHQAARLLTDLGLRYYLDRPILTDSELVYFEHDRRLTSAYDAWQRALEIDTGKRDCSYYLALALGRIDRWRPAAVESTFAPMLADLADRPLRAEILDFLGEVYWQAGEFAEARRRFAASYDVFSLPKRPNIRAQKKLGGL
jgi:tetratricopeptide (TPR) repeat protein